LAALLASALLAAVAFGATSASATVLCKKSPSNHLCGNENLYPAGTKIHTELAPNTTFRFAVVNGTSVLQCKTSTLDLTTDNSGNNYLEEEILANTSNEGYTFGGCYEPVHASAARYNISWYRGTHAGRVWQETTFEMSTEFFNHWGYNAPCYYKQHGPTYPAMFGETQQIVYNKVPYYAAYGSHWSCPPELLLSGTYNIISPSPLYVETF